MTTARNGNGPVEVAGKTFKAAWSRDREGYKLRVHENDASDLPSLATGQQTTIQVQGGALEAVHVTKWDQAVHEKTVSLHLSFDPPAG